MRKISIIEIGMLAALLVVLHGDGLWLSFPYLIATPAAAGQPDQQNGGIALDDIRDIAVASERVWVATQAGLAVYDRTDGRLLFTLSRADGLAGDDLALVETAGMEHLVVAGRDGAVVLGNLAGGARSADPAGAAISVHPIDGLSTRDPVLGVIVSEGQRYLVQQRRGLVALNEHEGRWATGPAAAPVGMWSAASEAGGGILLGALDGTVARYSAQPRPRVTQFDDGADWERTFDFPVLGLGTVGDELVMATGESLLSLTNGSVRPIDGRNTKTPPAAVVAQADAGVVVGTVDGRIFQYRGERLELLSRAGRRITALEWDGDRVWVGVRDGGLHVVPLATPWRSTQASLDVDRLALDPELARSL